MFAGADEIEILALDFIHHGVHFLEAHNSGNDVAANHIGRNAVGEALVNHKITGIGKHCAVHTGNITHKIIEALAGNLSGGFFVNAVKFRHNIGMVGNFKIRVGLFTELLYLNVLAVILSYGNGGVYNVRNLHHKGFYLCFKLVFLRFKLRKALCLFGNKLLHLHGFLFFALSHKNADFLAHFVSVCAKLAGLRIGGALLLVKEDNLIHHGNLLILEFFSDVFFNKLGIFS